MYKPAVGQINFRFTSLEETQNVENVAGIRTPPQPVDRLVNPLVVAQYSIYNRELELENYGLDDNVYLGHKGGFISAGDKVNNKKSELDIRGNLTVRRLGTFYKTVDMENNSIRNHRQKGDRFVPEVYLTNTGDRETLTVGDFRRNWHTKGMVIMWSGSYSDLFNNMPYWRLCAPPDSGVSGTTENGVFIPNLEGHFIICANYAGFNNYQPQDNSSPPKNFGPSVTISHSFQGGFNGISLLSSEIPSHNHGVTFAIRGGGITSLNISTTCATANSVYSGGGEVSLGPLRTASDQCISSTCTNFCFNANGTAFACPGRVTSTSGTPGCPGAAGCDCQLSYYPSGLSINTNFTMDPFVPGSLTLTDAPLTGGIASQDTIGTNTPHENRPAFYVLGYIINVGKERS